MTPKEREEFKQSVYGGIGSLLKGGYDTLTNPIGSAISGASQIINSTGEFAKKTFDTISLAEDPRYKDIPGVQEAAAYAAAEAGLNYGVLGGVAGIAAPRPANSLGMFVAPSASPYLEKINQWGKSLLARGATEAEVFNETARRTRPGVSGLQKVITPEGETWGFEVSAPLNVKQSVIDRVDPSLLGRIKDATFGKLIGENAQIKDIVDTAELDEFYNGAFGEAPVNQMYTPSEIDFWKPWKTLGSFTPSRGDIDMNIPLTRGALPQFGERAAENFSPVLTHEGQHWFANRDNRLNSLKIPQGTNVRREIDNIKNTLEIKNLSMREKQIEALAEAGYWDKPGEVASQLAEKRRLNSPESMKLYEERLAAEREWENSFRHKARVEAIMNKLQEKKRGWRSAWDTVRLD